MRNRRSIYPVFILFLLIAFLSGCQPLRKKFVRKKKGPERPVPIYYASENYEPLTPLELYQKHYSYWRVWHSELIERWGSASQKKQVENSSQAATSLMTMQTFLKEEKASELQKYIDRMIRIRDQYAKNYVSKSSSIRLRRQADSDHRAIRRNFYYKDVYEDIKTEVNLSETAAQDSE